MIPKSYPFAREKEGLYLNINNFENHINKTILDRGYDYYIGGNIVEAYDHGDNVYIFQVQGREDYEVVVKIDNQGEIIYSKCDCPFDFGPICKHQVAAYFKLLEIINSKDNNLSAKKEDNKHLEIKEVLNNLSKEELIKIIIDITQRDTTLKNSLIVKYSKGNKTQEIEKCKRLMESIVRKYTGREGFIPYRETYGFVSEMEDLLEKSRNTDDILLALDIAFLLLNEAVEAFQYADDSDGEIGSLASEALELIGEIVEDNDVLDIQLREKIFNKLLEQSDNKVFDEWEDYKIDLFRLCVEFADVEVLRNKLRMNIEYTVSKNSGDEYKKYSNERLLQILFEIIDGYGTKEEAEKFIMENLKYSSFRDLLIGKFLKEKNFQRVIELAKEGEKQDKEYLGLVSRWKKIRYDAYKKLSLNEEQERLAKELLFDGDFEYYKELKELTTEDKTTFYNNLKQELKKDKGWHASGIFLKLIVKEKDLDEIMEFVRQNPRSIEEYAKMLQVKFNDEVIQIYKRYIKAAASSSSDRRAYQGVCGIIKRYKNIAGKKNQKEIVDELIALYGRRPAFVNELGKIR